MMIRLVGLVVLALGAVLAYFTYSSVTTASIVPQVAPVFYLGAGMLMTVGIIAVIAKYK